ncbi:MAG: dimethylsulfoniopropionate demethylase [Arenicellales bacterium]
MLSVSRRLRRTPFSRRVEGCGVKAYTVYNHMLLPTVFESLEADYHHLKRHVQVWDVACERQVEIRGSDAARLVQLLTPRNLSRMGPDQCFYAPMVDENGGMLNDPVILRPDAERYWISIADSDVILWVKGVVNGMGLDCEVIEPDVSPLAVQGPQAEELMARVFGSAVREIRFFRYAKLPVMGSHFTVARTGYSKQGGFEIYVEGGEHGEPLWDALFDAGKNLNVRAGGPNLIERIEGGLLSYGNDMTRENNPFECGLDKFCDTTGSFDYFGRDALARVAESGPVRRVRGVRIPGNPVPACLEPWPVLAEGERAGQVTSAVWSPDLACNVSIGMMDRGHWRVGTPVSVATPDGSREAEVVALPFGTP